MKNTRTKRHHGWQLPRHETLATPASYVTFGRTIIALGLAFAALHTTEIHLLYAGLAVYWIGDVIDGFIARKLHGEMRLGALLDVVCDRISVAVIYLVFVAFHTELLVAFGLYLFQFMVLDTVLSLAFLFWPLLSLNYFYLVDKRLYDLNWSPAARIFNSTLFIVVTALFMNVWVSGAVAAVNTAIKLYSLYRLIAVVGIPTKTTLGK